MNNYNKLHALTDILFAKKDHRNTGFYLYTTAGKEISFAWIACRSVCVRDWSHVEVTTDMLLRTEDYDPSSFTLDHQTPSYDVESLLNSVEIDWSRFHTDFCEFSRGSIFSDRSEGQW